MGNGNSSYSNFIIMLAVVQLSPERGLLSILTCACLNRG